jgi:aryl-alcohol dehydrogenase-like predicted oxidoreductase
MNTTPIIIGTNSWGGRLYAKLLRGGSVSIETIRETAESAIKNGFVIFDTARDYGFGKSQKIMGQLAMPEMKISAKFTPFSKKYKQGQVRKSLEKDLKDFNRQYVDIYWLHLPVCIEENLAEMITLYREGKIHAIGISNFNLNESQKAKEILDREQIPLFGVQNHYSLIEREWEKNGLVDWWKQNNVQFWAWAVLEEGALTGKTPSGVMGLMYRRRTKKLKPLIELMNIIGKKYNISTAQTAVVYCLTKGIVPLCGCRKPYQIDQLTQNVSIRFTPEEITALETAADKCGITIMKADMFRFMSK